MRISAIQCCTTSCRTQNYSCPKNKNQKNISFGMIISDPPIYILPKLIKFALFKVVKETTAGVKKGKKLIKNEAENLKKEYKEFCKNNSR